MARRLLAVDDDPQVLTTIETASITAGLDVETTQSGLAFKDLMKSFRPTVVAIDILMPDLDGFELIRWLGAEKSDAGIIMMNELDPLFGKCAVALCGYFGLGPVSVLRKPVTVRILHQAMMDILSHAPADRATSAGLQNPLPE